MRVRWRLWEASIRSTGERVETVLARAPEDQAVSRPDWAALYLAHGPGILRYLSRLAPDHSTAEDLLHDTFAKAMTAARRPASGDECRRWLYRIASNAAIDRLRRARRFPWLPLDRGGALEITGISDQPEVVRAALRSIPPDQAAVLVLRVQEGFSRSEIAELHGISEAAVKTRLLRARARFAEAYRRIEREACQ